MSTDYDPQPWMKNVLLAAGFYNLAWGAVATLMPTTMLSWFDIVTDATAVSFWQCIGMIVGVYGIGYLIATRHPYRHWPIVLVGLLGKLFGPLGYLFADSTANLPSTFGWTLLTNDVLWWIPFTIILWGAFRYHQSRGSAYESSEADDPLHDLLTNTGRRLDSYADQRPQLIVFLRHSGCTFCREAMADLSAQRQQIEAAGCGIVLVHLDDKENQAFFAQYGLDDVPRIADPECRLYRMFGLDLGGFSELFGLRVWLRGFRAGVLNGHGIGRRHGNTFQMPGIYLYHCGQILDGIRYDRASDRPNYLEFVKSNLAIAQSEAAS